MPLSPEDKEQLEHIIENAIKRAFRDVGIDHGGDDDRLFELRRDLIFLREWRMTCDLMKKRGIISGVTLLMAAFATVLLLGVKGWFFQ